MANPYQSLYFLSLGATPIEVGLLIGFGTSITILALLVGGYVADSWGRRRVIIIFSWVSVASALVFAAINSAYLIPIPLMLSSIASVYTPAFNALMMDSIAPGDRVRGFSVFNAINTTPSVFAPTFGGILMTAFGIQEGIRFAYLGSALFGACAISIRTLRLRETYSPTNAEKTSFLGFVKESFASGIKSTLRSNALVKKLLVYVTLAGIGTGLTSPFASIYVVDYLKIDPLAYSLVVDLAGLTTVILLFVVVFLVRRIGARNGVLVASVTAPLSNVIFTQAKTMDELLEWGVTGAVATAIQTPSIATMQAETINVEERGRILAMFSILPALVSIPSQVIGGLLYLGAPVLPFLASLLPFSCAALILFSISGKNRKQEEKN
jgi:MFS transporter, DHA1 family, tetracycline resistance protein